MNISSFPWEHRNLWTKLLLLTIATFCVYGISLLNGFVLDDEVIIVNNPQTLSLHNIPEVLLAPDLIKPYYRPLNRATYLFDYHIAGMNPAWYHGVNIIIHLGNVLVLYFLCRRILSDDTASLVAALLFAIHPVNSEAVNFISARNTLLALFFSLASLLTLMRSREQDKRWPLLSAVLFFCGLLSKETALMLIVVIAVYLLLPRSGDKGRKRPEVLLPYLLVTALYFGMRAYSLQGLVGTSVPINGLFSRLYQNYHIIPQYLGLLLVPVDLTLFHKVPQGGLFTPPWFLPVWVALFFAVWLIIRSRNRAALFCLGWIIINYAPISNIVPIPSDQMTERYLYMPAAGFFILLGVLFSWASAKRIYTKALWGGAIVISIAFAALSLQRNLDWKNNLSLFSSGARNDPFSPAAHYNLGTAFQERGDLESARHEWEKTLALDPNYADALTQMGTLAAVRGDLIEAEKYYHAALRAPLGVSDPDKSMAHYNLGKIYEKWQQPMRALRHYEQFMKEVPITYLEYKPDAEKRIAYLRSIAPSVPPG